MSKARMTQHRLRAELCGPEGLTYPIAICQYGLKERYLTSTDQIRYACIGVAAMNEILNTSYTSFFRLPFVRMLCNSVVACFTQ